MQGVPALVFAPQASPRNSSGNNRAIETAQVIEELIQMAKEFQATLEREAALGLNHDEIAFYDALANNESAVRQLGDDKFPINLFSEIVYSPDLDFNKTFSVKGINKGELTEQAMSLIPINEDSFWSDAMAHFISSHLLRVILEANPNNALEANTATAYWEAIQREAAHMVKAGRNPILILENPTRPEWIWQWQNDNYSGRYPVPVDMQVQRREGWGEGYVCHLNEIAVYSSSQVGTGRSVLIAKEAFKKVTFRRVEDDTLVDVRATPTKDSTVHVDVTLAAGMKVEPCGYDWLQITYTNNGN